jgi:O-antigen ligase
MVRSSRPELSRHQEPLSEPREERGRWTRLWNEEPVETAFFAAFIASLAWAPFWLGGDRMLAWGVNGILFPALVVLYEISLALRGRRHPFSIKSILGPFVLFFAVVFWATAQATPEVSALFSHPLWGMTAEVLQRPVKASISLNRGETGIGLIRLLTTASVFWLSLELCRERERVFLLLWWIVAIVAAYSIYGLVCVAVFSGGMPFFPDVPPMPIVRSAFVGRNNFATYAGMGLIVNVALIFRLYRDAMPGDGGALTAYRLSRFLEVTGERGLFLLGSAIAILAALLGSVSRGGILATGLGIFVLYSMIFSRRRRAGKERLETVALVTVALVACFAFFGDLIVGRISTEGLVDLSRLTLYSLTVHAIFDAPMLGFGYGTFQDVFPMYRDPSFGTWEIWDKAHNAYLEVWLGLGLVFGTMLVGCLVWLAAICFRGAMRRERDATAAIVATVVSVVVGVHALVDFSIQIEGVAITFMALLGAGVAQSQSSRVSTSD